jgi:tetratricopeptide (TPR) repeat protein
MMPTPMLRCATLLVLLVAAPAQGSAQQDAGDRAWDEERYDEAMTAYLNVVSRDSTVALANFRLGLMLSWRGELDSALVFLGRARRQEPRNVEIRLAQARVQSWSHHYSAALSNYDSLLAEQPGLAEAQLGRARALAWSGDLGRAEKAFDSLLERDPGNQDALVGKAQVRAWRGDLRGATHAYRTVLARNPRHMDALIGLGYVYHWQRREGPAARQAHTALAIDSTNRDARELRRIVHGVTRSAVETSANWSNDSDDNTNWWQSVAASAPLAGGLRVFGNAGVLEASDPLRDATRIGGEAGLSVAIGKVQLTGAGGAQRLNPEFAGTRTAATYRGRAGYRPVPEFGLSAGYARYPFDEIAALIERDLDLETLDAGFDGTIARGLELYGSGGEIWFSDGNNRSFGLGGVTQTIRRRFFVGAFGRIMSDSERGIGYFSPDRFYLLEGQAGYSLEVKRWTARVSGGLGGQQIGRRGAVQTEWHIEGRLARGWGAGNRIEIFGLVTNSAVSSTTGAFRYRSAGITLRLGI